MAACSSSRTSSARYGPVQALHGVSLAVDEGEIVAVLGANGAGKTTTLRAISGTVRRDGRGPLRRAGALPPRARRRSRALGIAHVPEGRGTFAELTVWENLRLGAYTRRGAVARTTSRACSTYFPWLDERRDAAGRHAQRRRAADARARRAR